MRNDTMKQAAIEEGSGPGKRKLSGGTGISNHPTAGRWAGSCAAAGGGRKADLLFLEAREFETFIEHGHDRYTLVLLRS